MKLSIIIPTYNSEKYLEQTLKSINDQILDNGLFEVIFIDAFSGDNTINIINNFQYLHNVKLIKSEAKGPYNAMNIGIGKANGEYILCLNSDDFLEKNILGKYLNFIKDTNQADLYYSNINFYKNGKIVGNSGHFHRLKNFLFFKLGCNSLIFHPGVLAKKTTLLELGLFDESKKIASDYGMRLNMLYHKKRMLYYPYTVSNFRIHEQGISSSKKNIKIAKKELKFYKRKYFYKSRIGCIIGVLFEKIPYILELFFKFK